MAGIAMAGLNLLADMAKTVVKDAAVEGATHAWEAAKSGAGIKDIGKEFIAGAAGIETAAAEKRREARKTSEAVTVPTQPRRYMRESDEAPYFDMNLAQGPLGGPRGGGGAPLVRSANPHIVSAVNPNPTMAPVSNMASGPPADEKPKAAKTEKTKKPKKKLKVVTSKKAKAKKTQKGKKK